MTPNSPIQISSEAPALATAADDGSADSITRFAQLKASVLERRPMLKKILAEQGNNSLTAYAEQYYRSESNIDSVPAFKQRKEELIQTLGEVIARQLGDTAATKAMERLRRYYFVSTADHHGPIVHPFFLSANLLAAQPQVDVESPASLIVLACGGVSLENSSFPRGILFTSAATGNVEKFPFFSTHIHPSLISHLHPYGEEEMKKVFKLIGQKVRDKQILSSEADWIADFIEEIYLQPDVLKLPSFSEQVTKTNFSIWKKFFPKNVASPDLVYLELEAIVNTLLQKHHITADTFIHRILFDKAYREKLDIFDGIEGAYSTKDNLGTFLFWGVPQGARYRVQLRHDGDALVADDGSYRLPLTPTAVADALAKKEIIPSVLLSLLVLGCYYGLTCQGGFCQVNYLTEMRDAYISLARATGDSDSEKIAATITTDELAGDVTVAFLGKPDGNIVPATGIDWLMRDNGNAWDIFANQARSLSLTEALDPMMPEFYRIMFGSQSASTMFPEFTTDYVMTITQLDKKITPCVSL